MRTALWDDWITRKQGKEKNVPIDERMKAITGQADTWIDTCEHCGYVSEQEEHKYTGEWDIDPLYHSHTCTLCGHVEKKDHKYSEDEHKCTECGRKVMTVKFIPGEGTGTEIGQFTATGESFQLPECTFKAPSGQNFIGWKKTSEGGEPVEAAKIYKAGD